MRQVMQIVLLFGAFLFLQSCGPLQTTTQITPSSYRESFEAVPRTVGKLRRLVMVSVIQPAPAVCAGGKEKFDKDSQDKIGEAYYHLYEKKGYDVIPVESFAYEAKAQIPAKKLAEYSTQLADWTGKSEPDGTPTDSIKHIIDDIGLPVQADGVVILHAFESCLAADSPALRGLIAISSLGLSEIPASRDNPNSPFKTFPKFVVAVCETRSGRIVWKNTSDRARMIKLWKWTKPGTELELLFDPLDNAVPKVLTR